MRRLLCLAVLVGAAVLALAPAASAQSGNLDCSHFATQEAPQAILDANPGDAYALDADDDGIACETDASGAAEDGTAVLTQQYQYEESAGMAEIPDTGGPSLLVPAALAATLLVGCCVLGLSAVARRSPRAGDLGGRGGGE